MEKKLTFLLMGTIGHGKSATGNSILNKKAFKASAQSYDESKDVEINYAQFGRYHLKVVDGLGLPEDVYTDKAPDKDPAGEHLQKALAMCPEGVDAFLFVRKFGIPLSHGERSALDTLNHALGETLLPRVIVVLTGGDFFQDAVEEEGYNISFHEWSRKLKGEFQKLYKDCNGRFMLFNNREKEENKKTQQVQELIQLTESLQVRKDDYNLSAFNSAEAAREKAMADFSKPHLTEDIQGKMESLSAEIKDFAEQPSKSGRDKIEKRIQVLKEEIEIHDKGYGTLGDFLKLLEEMKRNFDGIVELKIGNQAMEDVAEKLYKNMEKKLTFLLMGTTGHGKSATGNSILNKKAFKASAQSYDESKDVEINYAQFGRYYLKVVDGLGLPEDVYTDKAQDKDTAGEHLQKALAMCPEGVDAFLFVRKFGIPLSHGERCALDTLNHVLGETLLPRVIVVLTGGDFFQDAMEEEGYNISFHEWSRKLKGEFQKLYKDCNGRFVLFNNREKDENKKTQQVQELIQLTESLQVRKDDYNLSAFNSAEAAREKAVADFSKPHLTEDIQGKMESLSAEIKDFAEQPSKSARDKIEKRIQVLKEEIEIHDKGHGTLGDFLKLLEEMKRNFDGIVELKIGNQAMEDVAEENSESRKKLTFLLMGKTGQGKSATGNSLLNRRAFTTSSNVMSVTKHVESSYAQFLDYILLVVDGPGLEDTDLSSSTDKEAAAKNVDIALGMCSEGVDAFLLVIKFGNRFTGEDKSMLEALKRIFGESYFLHVIVVMTCGDMFQDEMEYEGREINFHDWCRQQKGEMQKLYEDCNGRFVLFNNRERNEEKKLAQVQQLVQLAEQLQFSHGRYNSACFVQAKAERERLILEAKAPHLIESVQEKISLLSADIEMSATQPSLGERKDIRKRIQDLKNEIEVHDQGLNVLADLRRTVHEIEQNLDDSVELQRLARELEDMRRAKKIWTAMGAVCVVVGSVVAFSVSGVGIPIAATGAAIAAASFGSAALARKVRSHKDDHLKEKRSKIANK